MITTLNRIYTLKSSQCIGNDVEYNRGHFSPLSHHVIKENSVYNYELASSSSQLSRWGSVESRETYVCLTSLANDNLLSKRQCIPGSIDEEGWGHFIEKA